MQAGYDGVLLNSQVDGPTLTAAAAATMLPTHIAGTVLPGGFFAVIGTVMRIRASGRISCVVTTPGTARFDIRLGGNVVFDTLAMGLNVVAQATVGWDLDVVMTLRAVGTTANFMGRGVWVSQALVGSSATAGVGGICTVPFNTAPVVGGNFNNTLANVFDSFFTQTVATGSLTCHEFIAEILN